MVAGFPLRGEWVAVGTPAHRIPSYRTDRFGLRYAFDFVRPDQRKGLSSSLAARIVCCCWVAQP